VLALTALLSLAGAVPAGPPLVDAVVGQVGPAAVTVSDIALARALGFFGFTPSMASIDAADVDRYAAALGAALEAGRIGLGPAPDEVEQAWVALEHRQGGAVALQAWLEATTIDVAWARRALEADLRWQAWQALRADLSEGQASQDSLTAALELPVRRLLPMGATEPVPFAMPSPGGG
jgi:hypothetical protein